MARRRHHRSSKRRSKNILNKTIEQTVSVAKNTSRKYMPKVKSGLENVGNKVVKTSVKTIPFLQSMTRKFFGMFTGRTTKRNRRR